MQSRQKLVRNIREAVSANAAEEQNCNDYDYDSSISEINSYVSDTLLPMLRSVAVASRGEASANDIASLKTTALLQAKMSFLITKISFLRPEIAKRPYFERQIETLGNIFDLYLQALEAPSILEAQKRAHLAQIQIDGFEDCQHTQRNIEEALERLGSDDLIENGAINFFEALRFRHMNIPFADLEKQGRFMYEQLTGSAADIGTGLNYAFGELMAEAGFDWTHVQSTIRRTAELSAGNPEIIGKLATNNQFLDDLHESKLRTVHAWVRFHRTTSGKITTHSLIREVLSLYSDIFEQLGIPLMGFLLLISGQKLKTYDKLKSENATTLADNVSRAEALDGLIEGLDNSLRNATSHGHSYVVDNNGITVNLKSFQGKISVAEIADKTLALMESFTAVQMALDNELAIRGHDGHQVRDLELYGFSPISVAELLLKSLDVTVHSLVENSSEWRMRIGETPKSKFTLAKIVCDAAPAYIDYLWLIYEDETGSRTIRAQVQILAAVSSNQLEDPVKYLRAVGSIEIDGVPVLNQSARRGIIAVQLLRALDEADIMAIPMLRSIKNASQNWLDPEVGSSIDDAIRWLRGVPVENTRKNYRSRLEDRLDKWKLDSLFELP